MRLELPPGGAVSEAILSERLGIGRTPIREALQRLETQGVVEAADCPLIINHRVIGYRLTITPAEIRILD